jgi:hypothetical protein
MTEQQKVNEAFETLLKEIDTMCETQGSDIIQRNHWDHEIKGGDSLVTFRLGRILTTVNVLNDLESPYPIFSIDTIVLDFKLTPVEVIRENDLGIDFEDMERKGVAILLNYQSPRFTKIMEDKYLTKQS